MKLKIRTKKPGSTTPSLFQAMDRPQSIISRPRQKYRILGWHDSPTATSGFGIVAKHILRALYDTGEYDIDVIGINFNNSFFDKKEFPYTILPATMSFSGNKDPYGNALVVKILAERKYDILFVINDTFSVSDVSKYLQDLQNKLVNANAEPFKIVYYFPVDCRIRPNWVGLLKLADRVVAYNQYGATKAKEVGIISTDIIPHGSDIKGFYPLSRDERRTVREKIFHITNDNVFLFINVNRNSLRKDMARTILAFSEFRKQHPNSVLYLHTSVVDGLYCGGLNLDLTVPCEELGLRIGEDVKFPSNYSPIQGVPVELLNKLYNAADAYLTTTLGEGWGIGTCEAAAVGIPVIAPDCTSFKEILGKDGERGYLFPCAENIYIDSSGFRPFAQLNDIVSKMEECYMDRWSKKQGDIIKRAREFTKINSWENVNKKWIKLFQEVCQIDKKREILMSKREKMVNNKGDAEWL